ncbi:Methionyl aminopeptidase [Bertholletia excelsa]
MLLASFLLAGSASSYLPALLLCLASAAATFWPPVASPDTNSTHVVQNKDVTKAIQKVAAAYDCEFV